jgi:hypothetical protein
METTGLLGNYILDNTVCFEQHMIEIENTSSQKLTDFFVIGRNAAIDTMIEISP